MNKNIYDNLVKRTVLYSLILWWALFLVTAWWAYKSYWDYSNITSEKWELLEKMKRLSGMEKHWLSFGEYKTAKKDYKDDRNLENIAWIIEKDFFEESFKNEWEEFQSFDEFIKNKEKNVDERLRSDEELAMRAISNTVLPSFNIHDLDFNENNPFSELQFVNYVETIMQTFNLEYSWDIGIGDVLPIETEESKKSSNSKDKQVNEEDLLVDKIFYIPLSFSVVGNKASIIDFIYFVEKVWNVNIASENLEIYSDSYFEKWDKNYRNADLVLDWAVKTSGYNPYLNQLIDVESIAFEKYIYEKRDGDVPLEFLSNIRKFPQGQEEFSAEVTLRFYVKGVSDYKVEKKYQDTIAEIVTYIPDVQKSIGRLSALSTKEKTPEIALLMKRLVTYQTLMQELEVNLKRYKALTAEEIYDDILTSLDIIGLIEKDLVFTSSLTWLDIEGWRLGRETQEKKIEQAEKSGRAIGEEVVEMDDEDSEEETKEEEK